MNMDEFLGKKVMVTTSHRGVFAGMLESYAGSSAILSDCRMLLFRVRDQHGVYALATEGPNENCRVGPAVGALLLEDCNSITVLTDAAATAWESEPWGK